MLVYTEMSLESNYVIQVLTVNWSSETNFFGSRSQTQTLYTVEKPTQPKPAKLNQSLRPVAATALLKTDHKMAHTKGNHRA